MNMKAIIDTAINKNRNELQKVIPLETPYAIDIDPSNLCNFKCKFCATHSSEKGDLIKKQNMSFELFKKIIDDLAMFPQKLKMLRITGNGEPLINKELPQMIAYAKNKNIAEYIEIFTNGSLLSEKMNRDLVSSGLDRIRISIEALDEEGYKNIAGVKIDFEKFLTNIKDLYDNKKQCEIYIKIVDLAVKTEEEKEKYYNLFGDKCDKISIDNIIPFWPDFDNMDIGQTQFNKGVHGQEVQNVKICPYIFYSLLINTDGRVTACCADWEHKLILGDISKESLLEVWNGQKLYNFWVDILKGKKDEYEMCKKCLLPSYDCNDNIDAFSEEILEKIIKK